MSKQNRKYLISVRNIYNSSKLLKKVREREREVNELKKDIHHILGVVMILLKYVYNLFSSKQTIFFLVKPEPVYSQERIVPHLDKYLSYFVGVV